MESTNTRPRIGSEQPYVCISRPAINQTEFDELYGNSNANDMSFKKHFISLIKSKCYFTTSSLKRQLLAWFPFITLILTYRKSFSVGDVISGLSVGVVHVPQGMGFALLSSVKPIYGLYSSFFPNIVYFFLGSSRHSSVGTMALVSLMVGTVVDRELRAQNVQRQSSGMLGNATSITGVTGAWNESLTHPVTSEEEALQAIGIATSLTLLVGLFQIAMGILNVGGLIIRYMSGPFVGGFTTGAACQIFTSQLAFVLGLSLPRYSGPLQLPKTYASIFGKITQTNIASLIIAVSSIVFLVILKEGVNERCKSKMKVPIPAELFLIIGGTLISYFAKLNNVYGVKIVGEIPKGFVSPSVPDLSNAQQYVVDAIIIAVVAFVLSMSMAKMYMLKYDYIVDTNQEAFAYGSLHVVGSLFHCFAGAAAPPRCTVHDTTGGNTQVASLVSCVLLLIVILFIGPYFATLPNSVLASIIIVALIPMFKQFRNLRMLWRVNKWDFAVWLVSLSSVVVLDIVTGLAVGMGFSMFTIIIQTQCSKPEVMSVTNHVDLFSMDNHKNASNADGITLFRFQGMLCYTNAEDFRQQITASINANCDEPHYSPHEEDEDTLNKTDMCNAEDFKLEPRSNGHKHVDDNRGKNTNHVKQVKTRALILDCAGLTYIDVSGLNAVKQLAKKCETAGIELVLAECRRSVITKIRSADCLTDNDKNSIFPTIQDAMSFAMNNHVSETSSLTET